MLAASSDSQKASFGTDNAVEAELTRWPVCRHWPSLYRPHIANSDAQIVHRKLVVSGGSGKKKDNIESKPEAIDAEDDMETEKTANQFFSTTSSNGALCGADSQSCRRNMSPPFSHWVTGTLSDCGVCATAAVLVQVLPTK